jgi:purine nucleosidase
VAKKVLIDCDPGIDDALAIALAHGSPEVEVVGLTTVDGNADLRTTTTNALSLAEFYGMSVPVAAGADRPLLRAPSRATEVHGVTGLGGASLPSPRTEPVREHAVDFLIDTLANAPGEISLTAIGPLTNIALALRKEPRIAEWAAEFVIMGGSFTRGNRTPCAEFNIGFDPEAAAIVFGTLWRSGKLVMIGLDLTLQARMTARVRSRLAGLGRFETELLAPSLDFYSRHRQYRDEGPPIHDACAVAYVLKPGLLELVPARVDIETEGRFTSGMTVTDFDSPAESHNVLVATRLDTAAFWDVAVDAFGRVARGLPQ